MADAVGSRSSPAIAAFGMNLMAIFPFSVSFRIELRA
jgi:hypothetical protein